MESNLVTNMISMSVPFAVLTIEAGGALGQRLLTCLIGLTL